MRYRVLGISIWISLFGSNGTSRISLAVYYGYIVHRYIFNLYKSLKGDTMNLINALTLGARRAGAGIQRESPMILTVLGVSGLFSTTIMAVKATPKAVQIIWNEENDRLVEGDRFAEPLSFIDKVKLVWPCYIPTGISLLATTACIIGVNSIHVRRNAALVTLYSLSEASLKEYQRKVVELVGSNKNKKVLEEIAQDKLDNDPVEGKEVIMVGKGDVLFYDSFSARYFRSDMETVRQCQNDFNYDMLHEMYKPINEFYDALGLERIETGKDMGWNVDDGYLDIRFTAKIATNNEPCIVMEYSVYPKYL